MCRDLVLQVEDVGQLARIVLRPQMRIGRGLDELCRDADLVAGFADAALQHVGDVEFCGDGCEIRASAFKRERRGP